MIERSFTTPLPLELEVSIPSGQIDVETIDGEESHVVVDGHEKMLENVDVRHDGRRLVVELRGKSKFGFIGAVNSSGLHVRASVPHGASAKIKTASADADLAGRLHALTINTVSGDARIRGEIEDDASVKSVSGDVELGRVGGDVSIQTVSGDLRAGLVGGSIDTKSVSGDIRVDSASSGRVRFTSVSGDVEIGIAEGSLLDVDAGSTSGDLASEVPLASDPLDEMAGDAPTVELRGRTVSGDVRVFRAS